MIAETNWGRYFDRLQNPQVQMPKIDNRRQAESHPSLLEDGRGANRWSSESRVKLASTMPSRDRGGQNVKEEDDSQNCPTLSAVMHNEDKDKVYEIELGKNHPDEDLWN